MKISILLIFIIFSFIFISCNITDPISIDIKHESVVFIDYNQDLNQIFTSVSLDDYQIDSDSTLNATLTWIENTQNIIGCIENDSLMSTDFLININLEESNCIDGISNNRGCMDELALNFDPFAVEHDSSCIFDMNLDWHQFKFGQFDEESYSFPIYLISTTNIQWFQFELIGIEIDSLVEVIPNSINNHNNNLITSEFLFPVIESGITELCRIFIPKPPLDINLTLFDNASNGDIIEQNNIFHSLIIPEQFLPGEYQFNLSYLDKINIIENFDLIYNFAPKIISIDMPDSIMLNDSLYTSLEFFVTVFDANYGNDIKNVKYLINVSGLTNDLFPEEGDDVFISDPSWSMDYFNWIEKNTYSYKTIIPMKPAMNENPENEGKVGEAKFRFNVYDKQNKRNRLNNESQFEKSLWVLKCGDGYCSDGFENQSTCAEDCFE
jgi:hypothetical protein